MDDPKFGDFRNVLLPVAKLVPFNLQTISQHFLEMKQFGGGLPREEGLKFNKNLRKEICNLVLLFLKHRVQSKQLVVP